MKPTTIFNLIILASIGAFSCKKDKLPDAGGNTLDRVVIKDFNPGVDMTYTYAYDQQARLISMSSTLSGSTTINDLFNYDTNGKLITYTIPNILTYVFAYDGNGRIIKKIGTAIWVSLQVDDFSYAYDAQNRVIADTQYNGQSKNIVSYRTYTYDATGNITEINDFSRSGGGPFTNSGKTTYTYDNKSNPYSNISASLYFALENRFALCKNNPTGSSSADYTTSLRYSYYSNGLPESQNTKNSRSTNTSTSRFYFKQP